MALTIPTVECPACLGAGEREYQTGLIGPEGYRQTGTVRCLCCDGEGTVLDADPLAAVFDAEDPADLLAMAAHLDRAAADQLGRLAAVSGRDADVQRRSALKWIEVAEELRADAAARLAFGRRMAA